MTKMRVLLVVLSLVTLWQAQGQPVEPSAAPRHREHYRAMEQKAAQEYRALREQASQDRRDPQAPRAVLYLGRTAYSSWPTLEACERERARLPKTVRGKPVDVRCEVKP